MHNPSQVRGHTRGAGQKSRDTRVFTFWTAATAKPDITRYVPHNIVSSDMWLTIKPEEGILPYFIQHNLSEVYNLLLSSRSLNHKPWQQFLQGVECNGKVYHYVHIEKITTTQFVKTRRQQPYIKVCTSLHRWHYASFRQQLCMTLKRIPSLIISKVCYQLIYFLPFYLQLHSLLVYILRYDSSIRRWFCYKDCNSFKSLSSSLPHL